MKPKMVITIILLLIVATACIAMPVSACEEKQVTRNSFTVTNEDYLYHYSWVVYGVQEHGFRLKTPVTYTPKPYHDFTVTVPGRWGGRLIYYQVCTTEDVREARVQCEAQQSVQLSKERIKIVR